MIFNSVDIAGGSLRELPPNFRTFFITIF